MIKTYSLSSDIVKLCENFSELSVGTNADEYAKRNQVNIDKIKYDILLGKLAEWGVYFIYLERNRKNISPPDMNIYSKYKKSFDPDLQWGLYKLHIKSQDEVSASRYGDSWLFQTKDPLFEFSNEYDIVIGCRVSLYNAGADVTIILERQFKILQFSEPKLKKLVNNKKALYLKDNNE